jgi:hypothetical protein
MQRFQGAEKTIVAFIRDGQQWGERGEFCGPPKVAFQKAETHLAAIVRAGYWPTGKWTLLADSGEKRNVEVRRADRAELKREQMP